MKIVRALIVTLIVSLAFVLVACDTTETVKVTGIQLQGLSGEGTLASPYKVTVMEDENISANISVLPNNVEVYELEFTLGQMSNATFSEGNAAGIRLASDNSKSKLSIDATTAGVYAVRVKLKDGDLSVYVEVTVTEEIVEEDVLVTSVTFPTISEGEGTASNPYKVEIAYTQSANFSFAVLPNNATDKSINWEIVEKDGEDFVVFEPLDDAPIELESTATRITITAVLSGETGYVRGTTEDGSDISVFVEVSIAEFNAVESIEVNGLLEAVETDFYFKTAVGTTFDMSDEELARKAGLLDGTAGPGGGQAPLNLTYWPSLYGIGLEVLPETASNPALMISYSEADVFTLNLDGTFEALNAGTTIVTISSVSDPDIKVTIAVEVVDTLYPGILKSEFDDRTTSDLSEWNFDGNPDNLGSIPLLEEWHNVFLQTNSNRGQTGDDANQKIFYLGEPNRVYGIAVESRVNNNKGDLNKPTAMIWNKVFIGAEATTIDLVIGNNDKVHNEYRITIVDSEGTIYIVKDWTGLTTPNGSNRVNDLAIPEGAKDKTVALVIEQRLTEKENNAELHIKGIWINQYTEVTSITLPETEGMYGQGATFNLGAQVLPSNATNKALAYQAPADSGITISETGQVTISLDTAAGVYTLTVMSLDNPLVSATYELTVDDNVPTTSFDIVGFEAGQTYNATFDDSNINHTDAKIQLQFNFNEAASDTTWTLTKEGSSVNVSTTGLLEFVGIGETVLTFTPNGNEELAITFTFDVKAYSTDGQVVTGIHLNTTEVQNQIASTTKIWNTQSLVRDEWKAENVNKDHGGSKVADYGDGEGRIVLEGHATQANFLNPINIIWNKLQLDATDKSFKFLVRSHDDDRVLESTNFRVQLITLGETPQAHMLMDWTTIAGRWQQGHHWFEVNLDVSAYNGQEVVILIEQTGSLQNNGDWAKGSDSGAGSYLHIKGFEVSTEEAIAFEDNFKIYGAVNRNLASNAPEDMTFINNPYAEGAEVFNEDGSVKPFKVEFDGTLGTEFTLPTTTPFIQNGSSENALFYMWGVYPALNNSHQNNAVQYEVLADDVLLLDNNVLTFNQLGSTELIVKYLAFGSTTEYVSLRVTIEVK